MLLMEALGSLAPSTPRMVHAAGQGRRGGQRRGSAVQCSFCSAFCTSSSVAQAAQLPLHRQNGVAVCLSGRRWNPESLASLPPHCCMHSLTTPPASLPSYTHNLPAVWAGSFFPTCAAQAVQPPLTRASGANGRGNGRQAGAHRLYANPSATACSPQSATWTALTSSLHMQVEL